MKRRIERADILAMAEYGLRRKQERAALVAMKRLRRVEVGPYATFYFENYETMWWQVHEMLWIEGGGEAQIEGELEAYNPLIPQGRELTATMMIEIDDPARRERELARLGGIERGIALQLGTERIAAEPTDTAERTTEQGKSSSVHFLRFGFAPAQIAAFRDPATEALLRIAHPAYGHLAVLSPEARAALAADFVL